VSNKACTLEVCLNVCVRSLWPSLRINGHLIEAHRALHCAVIVRHNKFIDRTGGRTGVNQSLLRIVRHLIEACCPALGGYDGDAAAQGGDEVCKLSIISRRFTRQEFNEGGGSLGFTVGRIKPL